MCTQMYSLQFCITIHLFQVQICCSKTYHTVDITPIERANIFYESFLREFIIILPPSSALRMEAHVPLKHLYLPISPHGINTIKTNTDISLP
jgi:hypothetical protein